MAVQLTKDSIDLGIIVQDIDAALGFYRDTLGFAPAGDDPMPGGRMWRLMCGTSMIKLLKLDREPKATAPPGGIGGATGYRYWTISVSNLAEMAAACEAGGYKVVVPVTEIRPGVTIAIVEDPEGNWVEFLTT
jgi:catechol 2,3-dioxygenase-like lactoylglutathione lyase family enzyme